MAKITKKNETIFDDESILHAATMLDKRKFYMSDPDRLNKLLANCPLWYVVHVLVNSAGTATWRDLDELSDQDWYDAWELNVMAPMRLMRDGKLNEDLLALIETNVRLPEQNHGDLLVMGGSCQRTWEHAVPKTARPTGPRISIQFRPRDVR